jgi:hypothetical protein
MRSSSSRTAARPGRYEDDGQLEHPVRQDQPVEDVGPAGLIEGFVTSSRLPAGERFAIGAAVWLAFIC